jgi:AraC-like DNA-binding protein
MRLRISASAAFGNGHWLGNLRPHIVDRLNREIKETGSMRLHNSFEQEISRKFRVSAPTLQACVGKSPPIAISLVRGESPMQERSRISRAEDAYVVHIMMREVKTESVLWLNRHSMRLPPLREGALLMANLECEPSIMLHDAFEFVRYYVSKETLDTLGAELMGKRSEGLRRPEFGTVDPILFHLAAAAAPLVRRAAPADQLLIEQIALSFYRRVIVAYGGFAPENSRPTQGRLAPWQERRVKEYIEEHLPSALSLEDLAAVCRLSASHFARAFRRTTARTPHRWVLERRVDAAKTELLRSEQPLADLSSALGFSNASHFSRVFVTVTGETPADWRRRRTPATTPPPGRI